VPEPVGPLLTNVVMRPKVDGAEMSARGAPYCARLKRLKTSARNCKFTRSVSVMRRFMVDAVDVTGREQIGPLAPHIGNGTDHTVAQLLLNGYTPLADVLVLTVAVEKTGRDDPRRLCKEGVDRIGQ
jgi:hypothetical protein